MRGPKVALKQVHTVQALCSKRVPRVFDGAVRHEKCRDTQTNRYNEGWICHVDI